MRLAPILAGLLAQVPEPPVAATVAWEVPPGCPDRVALIDAIERRLARPLASGEVEVSGRITLHPQTPRYRLKLRLTAGGRGGERTLTAERCPPLADATALLVALAADQASAGSPFPTGGTTVPATGEVTPFAPNDEAILESADEPMIPAAPGPLDEPDLATTATLDATLAGEELHAPTPAPRPVQGAPGPGGSVRMGAGPELGGVPELTGTLGLAAGLLNADGNLDLMTIGGDFGSVSAWTGDGMGGFGAEKHIIDLTDSSLTTVQDVGQSPEPDLLALRIEALRIYRGGPNVSWAFDEQKMLDAPTWTQALGGDLGGAPAPELVAMRVDGIGGAVRVWPGTGPLSWGTPRNYTSSSPLQGGALADGDGDGELDLLAATGATAISVLVGTGTGGFACERVHAVGLPTAPEVLAAGELDGDAGVELLVGSRDGPTVWALKAL